MNLNIFNTDNLFNATNAFFEELGIPLNSNTALNLDLQNVVLRDSYKDREPFTNVIETYFAGLIDDNIFQHDLFDNKISYEESENVSGNYNGLRMYALKLNKKPTRTEIAEITRTFNRKSLSMPVALLFQYPRLCGLDPQSPIASGDSDFHPNDGGYISLALPERFLYKQAWRQGERVGKVIILKDISIEKTHSAHIRILEGLKIGSNVRSYNDLHKYWQAQFSLQTLNNAFYKDLQQWFYYAKDKIKLPYKPEYVANDDDNIKNFLVRLLARMMFCWFLKEKELIPVELLELKDYKGVRFRLTIDAYDDHFLESNSYYRGVLQNIFYESLNEQVKQSSKDFGWTKYLHPEFDFQQLIDIPYLNGGIFDKLEEDNHKESIEDSVLQIPNYLFYGNDEQKGLNEIFSLYKFTLEENTPYEEDIALDPELLGLVFENLLAELDPNLEENARRSIRRLTGSYYTPRKVVQEMVNESLFIYLKKHITPEQTAGLSDLIFNEEYTVEDDDFCRRIVTAIDKFKMLDPACGSGAFPMGMLHKLVDILYLVDRNNEKWIDLKLQSVDPNYRDEFKATLVQHRDNYSRKLGIIRDSIYGIDIQPLAVQITKLRFFISLLIDQKNGITPMPNIETKIICADSLKTITPDLFSDDSIMKLTEARRKYYQPNLAHEEKEQIAENIANELNIVFPSFSKLATGKSIPGQNKELIREWFTHGTLAAPFFNMIFFYPEIKEQGFDCVMGNPPYGGTDITDEMRMALFGANINDRNRRNPKPAGSKDPYGAFISRFLASRISKPPLKNGGVLAFIVSDTFMTIKSHLPLRKQMMDNYIHKMIRVHPDTFRATVNTAIIICERNSNNNFNPNHVCQMVDMTNISIHDDYSRFAEVLHQTEGADFGEEKQSVSNPEYAIYYYPQRLIKTNSNLPFFVASPKLFALMNDGNDNDNMPNISVKDIGGTQTQVRTICLNGKEIEVVKLGDIAEVKQGLATGDNGAYLFQNPEARGSYRSIDDYKDFLLTDTDLDTIRNNETLRLAVIDKGISRDNPKSERYFGGRYIIPHDKGGESDAETGWLPNYYVKTNYYIDWSEWAVNKMKTFTIADRIRQNNEPKRILPHYETTTSAILRNDNYYFCNGIDYSQTGIYCPTFRINSGSNFNTESTSIFGNFETNSMLGFLSSKTNRFFIKNFIDNTVHASADKLKESNIVADNKKNDLKIFVQQIINLQKSTPRYDYASNEQIEIDKLVYEAYGLSPEDVEEVENWYARRYPRLSEAQKQNLRNLGKSDDYLVLYGYKTEEK